MLCALIKAWALFFVLPLECLAIFCFRLSFDPPAHTKVLRTPKKRANMKEVSFRSEWKQKKAEKLFFSSDQRRLCDSFSMLHFDNIPLWQKHPDIFEQIFVCWASLWALVALFVHENFETDKIIHELTTPKKKFTENGGVSPCLLAATPPNTPSHRNWSFLVPCFKTRALNKWSKRHAML